MPTTQVVYPSADHAHAQELEQPLTVDGSAYTEPGILALDTAAYQGEDSNADGFNPGALTLPEIEGATSSGEITLMYATHWLGGAVIPNHYPSGTTLTFTIPPTDRFGQPFTLRAGDLIEITTYTQTTVAAAPATPTCTGLSLTWNLRGTPVTPPGDYRPKEVKRYAIAAGGETGTITVTYATSGLRRDGQMRIWRGVDTTSPYDLTWTAAQIVHGQSFPNAPSVPVTTPGATVYITAGGDVTTSTYTKPVVPTLSGTAMTEIVNNSKAFNARYPTVAAMRQGLSPGSYNPAAMTGLDYSNEYISIDVLKPSATVEIPVIVVTAVSDEVATAELVDGDVALSARNEVQRLRNYLVGSGTRTLTYSGQTTAAISFNATAAQVQTALEALSNIGVGDVDVSGGPLDTSPVNIEFTGALDLSDVATITVSGSNTTPVDEVQSLQSTSSGGTFALNAGTIDSSALPHDATAAQVQAALMDLPEIGLNNVEVTGGPLDDDPIVITFVSALGGTNVAQLTVNDDTTGGTVTVSTVTAGVAGAGMVIDTLVVGSAGVDLQLIASFLTRDGAFEPQFHVFGTLLSSYTPGAGVDVTVADHDNLHSWGTILLVPNTNVDPDDPIDVVGGEAGSVSGTTATYGSISPTVSGAKVLSLLAKAKTSGPYVGTVEGGSPPGGYDVLAEAFGDALTLMVAESPPVSAAATSPGSSAWSSPEAWATALIALKPLVGSSAGTSLFSVLNAEDSTTWIDIAPAAGNMFEVLEVAMGAIPEDAVITGALIELAHSSDVPSQLRIALVGIDGDDNVHLAAEQQVGYVPATGGATTQVTTNYWTRFADGSAINEYDRLGIALISSARHPALSNHRVYWARVLVRYEPGGPVVENVAGPASDGAPVTWDYSSDGGFPQTSYEAVIIQGSSQDPDAATAPDDPLAPATGELVYSSGLVPGTLSRSFVLSDYPLTRGACTVAVRAWSAITSSLIVPSDWDTANFDITGSPTATPNQAGTEPTYDPETGAVEVSVTAPAGATRAWLERSTDGGLTWQITEDSPFDIEEDSVNVLQDIYAPGADVVSYAVAFDEGPMTETGTPDMIGTAGVDTTPTQWLMIVPDDPTLTMPIEVAEEDADDPIFSSTIRGKNGSVVSQSPPLGHTKTLTLRTRSKAERLNLLAILDGGYTMRIVDILGQSWLMQKPSGTRIKMQRWKPRSFETTGLADAFEITFSLEEVSSR